MSSVDFEIHGVAGKDLYPGETVWFKNVNKYCQRSCVADSATPHPYPLIAPPNSPSARSRSLHPKIVQNSSYSFRETKFKDSSISFFNFFACAFVLRGKRKSLHTSHETHHWHKATRSISTLLPDQLVHGRGFLSCDITKCKVDETVNGH